MPSSNFIRICIDCERPFEAVNAYYERCDECAVKWCKGLRLRKPPQPIVQKDLFPAQAEMFGHDDEANRPQLRLAGIAG